MYSSGFPVFSVFRIKMKVSFIYLRDSLCKLGLVILVIPVLGRLTKEDSEFWASLGYTIKHFHEKNISFLQFPGLQKINKNQLNSLPPPVRTLNQPRSVEQGPFQTVDLSSSEVVSG